MRRMTLADFQKMKDEGRPIAMVTAYDYASALIAEQAGVPAILVGDSLGMVMQGQDTTLPVRVEDMIYHARMVMRGSRKALVVVDLPFLSYATEQDAVDAARRVMQEGGGQALKLEGGREIAPIVRRLTAMGVPVMGHLGLTPQAQHQIGLRAQAKEVQAARKLLDDARALEEAGAFGIVLEVIPADLAALVSKEVRIPTIGIGAGAGCDGQVQVWHDVLGLFEGKSPRHAHRFAEIGAQMVGALSHYVKQVEEGSFPTKAQSVSMAPDILAALTAE
ncbi:MULTISPECIES: 3-methyl-2-oxobutanoate hydroxymethyltransferase [Bombella]|uniref:3-methyl-2-oxobutanoate hydroxymethyltransferase n=1 Tax=Bombella pollinis TaxID=2967337 RepID=A0ABT3WJJ5_9PROT|nr:MULTISPECIES: 3-methyl-2-oxobutanoate hydroxymethyltransferase [Bombella]MCT6855419.1 3-methyl-2-oxobutanoate hydroxymethyltransferase [Bombella apis]MCX5619156.1 3-methyl-2-oxobutanoate hydroxymethyltransferase [Bombella pollinis]MUG05516.1 3-methyl-2-oxobutanoate hydroxymethyltransferase [Bombella sp. ESL0378]MUG89321.1 3-methyl-2-oxobutanoate hydroxymethyltransferase [Bombella sp. ESL0385]